MTRTFARGFRPLLPDDSTDWSRYCLQITTMSRTDASEYSVRTIEFPDKPAALAHARTTGAIFHT
ncbi:MAG: hypothetical protein ACK4GM_02220 [Tabrizicola sp.]